MLSAGCRSGLGDLRRLLQNCLPSAVQCRVSSAELVRETRERIAAARREFAAARAGIAALKSTVKQRARPNES